MDPYTRFWFHLCAGRVPTFSQDDCNKSLLDEQAPQYQPNNPHFVPRRTDENGNVILYSETDIECSERQARVKALKLRLELEPDTASDTFFIPGSLERKTYCTKPPPPPLTKNQKTKQRKRMKKLAAQSPKAAEGALNGASPTARASPDSDRGPREKQPRPRRYIVDSGASFHLVDPRTLTKQERDTIEDVDVPVHLETANGEVTVSQRALVHVKELDLQVWAFLKRDTVCVLSLGRLVDRSGFTYVWRPGRMPELVCGKKRFYCTTSSNVPFIYTVSYLEERRKRRNLRLEGSLSGATRPKASPASSSSKPSLADVQKSGSGGGAVFGQKPPPPRSQIFAHRQGKV